MRDVDVRQALWVRLAASHASEPDTLILDELGLDHGDVRVDVAVINGELHGYELKSEKDTLERLPRQVDAYNAVLDRATLIVGASHLKKAVKLIPKWWGVSVAAWVDGAVQIEPRRPAGRNPKQKLIAVAQLLWRNEALGILEEIGAARGVRSKPRSFLYERLTESLRPDPLRERVRDALKTRTGWRSGAQRT